MTIWQKIPDEPHDGPPFDGEEYLLYADSATVDIVRLGWWDAGGTMDYATGKLFDLKPQDLGWWSYRHSVTQEKLDYLPITHWAPFQPPKNN